MKLMLADIRRAALVTLALAVVCCGVYPVLVFGLSQVLFPRQANGSLLLDGRGAVRGSRLIGQPCSSDKYFHSRPSAAGNGYDPTSSGGSNLGPTSQKLRDCIAQNLVSYRAANGLPANAPVPADAVTASGSGLDPHISLENASLQAARVAKARGLALEKVRDLIRDHTDQPDLGFLGDPGVNVLELNVALDQLGSNAAWPTAKHGRASRSRARHAPARLHRPELGPGESTAGTPSGQVPMKRSRFANEARPE